MHGTLAARVDRLERENRRLKRCVSTIALVLAGAACVGQLPTDSTVPETLRTRRLEIVDNSGRLRAGLGVANDDPNLVLFDAGGQIRVLLAVEPDGPALSLLDEAGKERARLDAVSKGPNLGLFGGGEEPRAVLSLTDSGAPVLSLYYQAGGRGSALGISEAGRPGLFFYDETEELRAALGFAGDDPALSLFDEDGTNVAGLP